MKKPNFFFLIGLFLWLSIQVGQSQIFRSQIGRSDWILSTSSEVPSLFLNSYLTGIDLLDLLNRYYKFTANHPVPPRTKKLATISFYLQENPKEHFILEEIIAPLALLRGFWGRDCSTEVSPFYSLSPRERIFRIRSRSNPKNPWKIRGYVQGTEVSLNAEIQNPEDQGIQPTLYIHTLNGPNLKPEHVPAIIQAIQQTQEALGIQNIALTADDFLRRQQNNFQDLRDSMKRIVDSQNREAVPIYYIDTAYRQLIANVSPDAAYDRIEANSRAVVLGPLSESVDQKTLSIEVALQKPLTNQNSKQAHLNRERASSLNIYLFILLTHQQSKNHNLSDFIKKHFQ